MKRYSKSELYDFRNKIAINQVIEELLGLPWKQIDGVYRFLCPSCSEFTAAVNPKTNLSRCFRCKQNFNTIELIMVDRKLSFVNAVKELSQFSLTICSCHDPKRANGGS